MSHVFFVLSIAFYLLIFVIILLTCLWLYCSDWAFHCGGFSYDGTQALEHEGFGSRGTWAQ